MPFQKDKTFEKAEEAINPEPKRSDFQKGKIGDIKFKVAHTRWLEKIT